MIEKLKEETESLLKQDIFHFNKTRKSYSYFPSYVKSLLEEYNAVINNKDFWTAFMRVHYPNNPEAVNDYPMFTKMISKLSDKIILCIDAYYTGKVNQAYNYLQEGLTEITYTRSKLFQEATILFPQEDFCAYRIRKKQVEQFEHLSKEQMFHIPFDLRSRVTTQRFSIPGHPSLYLGDSIFVCWKELTEPKINEIYASRFINKSVLRIIEILSVPELKKRLEPISNLGTSYSTELLRYLFTFPLNIACSIKTKNHLANFKCEYIVPQLFLQFVSEHKGEIDGIKYYSTRVDPERVQNVPFNNFVFPTKTNQETGYCSELKAKFALTEPILREHEEINKGNVTMMGSSARQNITLELISGRKTPYDYTTFRAIELSLSFQSAEIITT